MLHRNVELKGPETAIFGVLVHSLYISDNFTSGRSDKAIGHESPIGPCVATHRVDNDSACCVSEKRWAPSQQRNGTRTSISPRLSQVSLPAIVGLVADGFDDWLTVNGYTRVSRKNSIRVLP